MISNLVEGLFATVEDQCYRYFYVCGGAASCIRRAHHLSSLRGDASVASTHLNQNACSMQSGLY